MDQELFKTIRIKRIKLGVDLIELEERIVRAIICGASPDLIKESTELWRQGREFLKKKVSIDGR